MNSEIKTYNKRQTTADNEICDLLANTIDNALKKQRAKFGTLILFGF